MRVVDVCGFYSPKGGGVRSYVEQKFHAARELGHELVVIAPGPQDRTELRPGGRLVWIESPPMPFDAAYHRFDDPVPVWRAMDALRPDVVEGSSPWRGGWIAGHWPGAAARAFVFHQDFVLGYPQTLLGGMLAPETVDLLFEPWWARLRRLSARYDVTVTAGAWLARRLEAFGLNRPVAVPFGIEPGRFSPRLRDPELRRRTLEACGAPEDAALILAVGRLHPEKRPRTLIEGFAAARARSERPLALAIVGDGPSRGQVRRLSERTAGTRLLGPISDRRELARLYASADLLIHGSAAETYGLVVAEALASGLPVIVPDGGGAAELARHGGSRLYPPGDALALSEAILEMLGRRHGRRAAPIPTSPEHFEALFGLYGRLLAERGRRLEAA
jgi:alpha-1,6-mannosyltransferase